MSTIRRDQSYYRRRYQQLNPNWQDSLSLLLKISAPFMRKGVVVLDAGCGRANYVVENFKSKIKKALGIDIDAKAVMGNVCLDQIVIGDLGKMPFPDQSFDLVLSQWVLEHLKNPREVFSEIFRVLKNGGSFVFVTPYKYSYILILKSILPNKLLSFFLKYFYGRHEEDVFATEYLANTPKKLGRMLAQAGFEKQTLLLNSDPSYLAVNEIFFKLAVFLEKFFDKLPFVKLHKMHILGVFRKPKHGYF